MIITKCPKCGSMNITSAGVCANCGWSQFAQVTTVSTKITGEIEIMLSGKALLDDYKRLLLENRNLKERVAELEAEVTKCHELQDSYCDRIAELEEAQRWIPVSERLSKESGWYYAGVLGRFGDHYTHDVYFYAEDAAFRWKDCEVDKVYCWLDGVPELPKPPEVK